MGMGMMLVMVMVMLVLVPVLVFMLSRRCREHRRLRLCLHIDIDRHDAVLTDRRHLQAEFIRRHELFQLRRQIILRYPGLQKCPQEHIAADAGKTIQINCLHSLTSSH